MWALHVIAIWLSAISHLQICPGSAGRPAFLSAPLSHTHKRHWHSSQQLKLSRRRPPRAQSPSSALSAAAFDEAYWEAASEFWHHEMGVECLDDQRELVKLAVHRPWLRDVPHMASQVAQLRTATGLQQPDLVALIAELPQLMSWDHQHLTEKLLDLQRLFPSTSLESLLTRAPHLLEVHAHEGSVLARKVAVMRELLSSRVVDRLVEWCPTVLSMNETTLLQRVTAISSLLHLDMAGLRKILLQCPAILQLHPEANLQPKIRRLRELLPGANATHVFSQCPSLLTQDFESSIPMKLRYLRSMLPTIDTQKLVMDAPFLLCRDVETTLPEKIQAMRAFLPANTDVGKVVSKFPNVLAYDVKGTLTGRFRALAEMFGEADATQVVKRLPALLCFDPATCIAPRLAELQHLFPLCDVKKLVVRQPTILLMVKKRIFVKLCDLETLLPGVDGSRLVSKAPRLLACDIKNTVASHVRSLQWLLGVSDEELLRVAQRCPGVLVSDVDGTIAEKLEQIPRVFPSADVSALVVKEPRLLEMDIKGTLAAKVDGWRRNVNDPAALDARLLEQPSILTYGVASVARLDHLNKQRPPRTRKLDVGETFSAIKMSCDKFAQRHPQYASFLQRQLAGVSMPRHKAGSSVSVSVRELESVYAKTHIDRNRVMKRMDGQGMKASEIDIFMHDLLSAEKRIRTLLVGGDLRAIKLRDLLPGIDAAKVMAENPKLLLEDADTLTRRMEQLRRLLPGVNVPRVIAECPKLLHASVERDVRRRLEGLVEELTRLNGGERPPKGQVSSMVLHAPQVLLTDGMVERCRLLESMVEDPESLCARLLRDPRLLSVPMTSLARVAYWHSETPSGLQVEQLSIILKSTRRRFVEKNQGYPEFLTAELVSRGMSRERAERMSVVQREKAVVDALFTA
ncbi:unnamed protein product [Vitrella brassicaformis CCMP3155]|uniref:Uncharacterized protein n=2 Tax=Vitrella brassicaformis TaxID=1169539 RepID=A0A0G4GCF2_VITBC|nr:unnamed protein product [Vitrella brassicaformis CCMP3155]|eukprot:CEM26946.1 unnamed protein product [Vitrella brassicaformis CCMP3155]